MTTARLDLGREQILATTRTAIEIEAESLPLPLPAEKPVVVAWERPG